MSPRIPTTAILLLSLATGGQAADFDAGKFLADKCNRCHDSSVYTRPNRRVQSLEALHNQVRRCDAMLGTKLFEDDLNALVEHLNQRYYHF
jgi:cytochrome c553